MKLLATLSSNVVLAKARTMYGRRLTPENYKDLLKCQTVSEVASYLKNRTDYAKVMAGIEETEIHRDQVEAKLRQKLQDDFTSLCRYEITVGERFSPYFIRRWEIEQILKAVLFLNSGEAVTESDQAPQMPPSFLELTSLDPKKLSHAANFDELLSALARTPYSKLLEPYKPKEKERIDYTEVEIVLFTFLYETIFQIIRNNTHGETKRQLLEIFTSFIDLTNYVRIVRLKMSYRIDPEIIKKSLLPYGAIDQKVIDEMAAAASEAEIDAAMNRTAMGRKISRENCSYVDEIPRRYNFRICQHDLHFSTHPSVVLIAYVFAREAEISDIITIVEGIRYKLEPTEIKKLLTILNSAERGG
jgi:V/A-type H+-transporting ATPase subunit C